MSAPIDGIQILVEHGADINQPNDDADGRTVLMSAASANELEVVQYLVAKGAKVDQPDKYGWTALMAASSANNLEIVKYLLANGAKPNQAWEYEPAKAQVIEWAMGARIKWSQNFFGGQSFPIVQLPKNVEKERYLLIEQLLMAGADSRPIEEHYNVEIENGHIKSIVFSKEKYLAEGWNRLAGALRVVSAGAHVVAKIDNLLGNQSGGDSGANGSEGTEDGRETNESADQKANSDEAGGVEQNGPDHGKWIINGRVLYPGGAPCSRCSVLVTGGMDRQEVMTDTKGNFNVRSNHPLDCATKVVVLDRNGSWKGKACPRDPPFTVYIE